MYAVCMQFKPEAGNIDKSRAKRTFHKFVCSVCSRFRSSSFFRLFPFKGTAYTAYKRMQNRSKTRLNPTLVWVYGPPTLFVRRLHTMSAYGHDVFYPVALDHGARRPGLAGSNIRFQDTAGPSGILIIRLSSPTCGHGVLRRRFSDEPWVFFEDFAVGLMGANTGIKPSSFTIPSQTMACMQFVCTMYAVCMQFRLESENIDKSRAKRTFHKFVCSVCSRFRSSSFFRLFPFKGTAYTAYKHMQNQSKTRLNPTPDWVYSLPPLFARQLHTSRAYDNTKNHGRQTEKIQSQHGPHTHRTRA